MKGRWLARILATGVILWLVWRGWKLAEDDPILLLIFFLFAGAGGGLFFTRVILPSLADAIGTSVFLSGERLRSEEDGKDSGHADGGGGTAETEAPASSPKDQE